MSERTLPELLDALIDLSTDIGIGENRIVTAADRAADASDRAERDAIRAEIIARFDTPAPDPDATA